MKMKNWSLERKEKGEGVFHNTIIAVRVPDFILSRLKSEAVQRKMNLSTFTRVLLEIGLEAWEKQKAVKEETLGI
jgi:predicted DNA binding CopG/RHH family protein